MTKLSSIIIDPETFLNSHCSLPALPQILTRIQKVIYSKEADVQQITELIKLDPALSAQILKVVNSAFYSLPMAISEIRSAVIYIGLNEVYRIILSLSVVNVLSSDNKKEFHTLWKHSVLTALCSKHLAGRFDPHLSSEELWTAALLHDVGKLLYLKFFPDHYRELRQYSSSQGCFFSDAEKHYSLPSSAYMGALLCDRWRLPDNVKRACAAHTLRVLTEADNKAKLEPSVFLITLGNLTAVLLDDNLTRAKKMDITDAIMKALALDNDAFLLLMADLSSIKEELEADQWIMF